MFSLENAMGERNIYLRRAWKIREPNRYGYIALEFKENEYWYSFYLLVGGIWKRLTFRRYEGDAGIYRAASSGTVVEVAMEVGNPRSRFQLLVEVEGADRWWLIYWVSLEGRVLLVSIRTPSDPYVAVI
jgi:hypothetical protein